MLLWSIEPKIDWNQLLQTMDSKNHDLEKIIPKIMAKLLKNDSIASLLQMAKNKLIRAPADTEVVSSFARQYQIIKAKKKQQQPASRQSSTEESDNTKVSKQLFSACGTCISD